MNQVACQRPDFPAWRRTLAEERVNAATHGAAFITSVLGALIMAPGIMPNRDAGLVIGCGVYLLSLIAVYASSTLSHSSSSIRWKSFFRRLDQGCIYLLIVATYTPFSLAYLRGGLWLTVLLAMWGVAIFGFVAKLFFAHRVESVTVTSYVFLGWITIIAIPSLWRSAPIGAVESMIAGGLCYTIGTVFLIYDEQVRHFHAVWHLLVIAGSACHFLGILVFVVGGTN